MSIISTPAMLSFLAMMLACTGEETKSSPAPVQQQSPASPRELSGTVLETMDAGGYTYAKVDCGDRQIWAAGPKTTLDSGDMVSIDQGMLMTNFHSSTLERTFDEIYFVSKFQVTGEDGGAVVSEAQAKHMMTEAHKGQTASTDGTPLDFSGLETPEGGLTVAEIMAAKNDLSGKEVLVSGKVVKFNSGIMGRNWIHLQDGTGAPGANDLTITTSDTAKVGDTVLVRGTIVLDKDFGLGYRYEILIEDASVTVQ
jgi:hypothetical protein